MKKSYLIIPSIIIALIFVLAACGSNNNSTSSNVSNSPTLSPTVSAISSPSVSTSIAYSVTYDGNGATSGQEPIDSKSYKSGDTVNVSDNTGNLSEDGYKFNGWNTAADGSGTAYTAAGTFTMKNANITLYAQWSPSTSSPVTSTTPVASPSVSPSSSSAYSVTPAESSTIKSGKSVTFTLKTPSSITSVYAMVDGVKQSAITTPKSNSGGAKEWKVVITFHKTGARNVKFEACKGTTVEKTFPGTAITITVK